jgi:hypothetical protein
MCRTRPRTTKASTSPRRSEGSADQTSLRTPRERGFDAPLPRGVVARFPFSCYAGPVLLQTLILTCGVGLGHGLRHALESDHVAAVTTIVVDGQGPRSAASIGAFWGLGHGAAVLAVGSLLLALDVSVPKNIAVGLELGVVVMLFVLGLRSFRRPPATEAAASSSPPATSSAHAHAHPHPAGRRPRTPLQASLVGLVHGAAGTSALVLLMLTMAPSRLYAAAFLATFVLGATVSMTLLSALFAAPIGAIASRWPTWVVGLRRAAGALSLVAAAALLHGLWTA